MHCHIPSSLGVILRTTDKIVWANEFEPIELTCLIESISTNNPRIEWKKIKNGVPSYVYFQNRIAGDLEHRAQLREPANILIFNTSRSDTAEYRCEVAAIDDQRDFDEILISLAVRVKPVVPRCSVPVAVTVGTSSELRCLENEGFPPPQYSWFHNNEELPHDPKSSPKFLCGVTLKGHAQCPPQMMEVYDVDIFGIFLKASAALAAVICVTVGLCHAHKHGCFSSKDHTENKYVYYDDLPFLIFLQGHFRHKSSFII
uniref:Junctional adhesion molecule 3 n=1 Tax=Myripristis murdjan TaxID=586833 RepID=A0A667XNU7_9TELE